MLLSEDSKMFQLLRKKDVVTETIHRLEHDPSFPVKVLPALHLARLYQELGTCIYMYMYNTYMYMYYHYQ